MEVSAISNKSFKGYYVDDSGQRRPRKKDMDSIDRIDFQSLADTVDNGNLTKTQNPLRYSAVTILLGAASLMTAKGASMLALQRMDGKFPLFGLYKQSGKHLNKAMQKIIKNHPEIKNVETFKDFLNNVINKMAIGVNKYGEKGINKSQLRGLKKAAKADLLAKRALQKATAATIGTGAGLLTIATRYKDEDGNGIPDKAEKALGTAKEIIEFVPAVASAVMQ